MKRYEHYNESFDNWLGIVPAHWKLLSLKRICTFRSGSGFPVEEQGHADLELPFFKVSDMNLPHNSKIMKQNRNSISRETASRLKSNIFPAHTIIFPKIGGALLTNKRRFVDRSFCIDNNLMGCIVRAADAKFVMLALQSIDLGRFAKPGPVPAISEREVGEIKVALPPLAEQRAIARYLDYMDRRIQRYIKAKQRLIELLEEQKRAVINQAVTRGLDPDVLLKPSGVEWLGDIPTHWELRRLKFLATKFGSGITPRGGASVYQETGIPFLRSQNVHFDGLRIDGVARIDAALHDKLSSSHVFGGDVLLNITGASIGRTCAVPYDFKHGNVNQHVCVIRPDRKTISPTFLAAFISSSYIQRKIRLELSGASREGLTLGSIRGFRILVPPGSEQDQISEYINDTSVIFARHSEKIVRQIELIKEYRTRLIADVVTGKLDVRDAAANLPDGVEEDELSDRSYDPNRLELAEVR